MREILEGYPGIRVERRGGVWDEGPRTHYEAKYIAEGRPILRLEITREMEAVPLHPQGALLGRHGGRHDGPPGPAPRPRSWRRSGGCPRETLILVIDDDADI